MGRFRGAVLYLSVRQTNKLRIGEREKERERKRERERERESYIALNRLYIVADYLSTVTEKQMRKTLTVYRLSKQSLAIETSRHRQISERTGCAHSALRQLHFFQHCQNYTDLWAIFFPRIENKYNNFETKTEREKIKYLLGIKKNFCATLASKYVAFYHTRRDKQWNDKPEQ